ncbi:MAG: hypothetical protein AAFQ94_04475 [Bacteroidota bacterium]
MSLKVNISTLTKGFQNNRTYFSIMSLIKTTLVVLLTVSISSLLAQSKDSYSEIIWGESVTAKDGMTFNELVAYDQSGMYIIKTNARGAYGVSTKFVIEHFDKEMNRTKSVNISLKEKGKKRRFHSALQLNNELYVLTLTVVKSSKELVLNAQTVDKNTLQLNNDLKKIASIDYSDYSINDQLSYAHSLSADSSKLLIYEYLPDGKDKKRKFGLSVFDIQLKLLWNKTVVTDFKQKSSMLEDFKVDNEGNVHLVGITFKEGEPGFLKSRPNYRYRIFSYYDQGNRPVEFPVRLESKFLSELRLEIDDDQNIVCGGLYSTRGNLNQNGSFFLKIDSQTREIISQSTQALPARIVKKERKPGSRQKPSKKPLPTLTNYNLDDFILKDNGGAIMIAEKYYRSLFSTTNYNATTGPSTSNTTSYNYDDIIVTSISAEGTIEWVKRIAKEQSSQDPGYYLSYLLLYDENNLHLVYNDDAKNLDREEGEKLHQFNRYSEAVTVMTTIDKEGSSSKQQLFSQSEAEVIIRPAGGGKISDSELVLCGQNKSKFRFAKIVFE